LLVLALTGTLAAGCGGEEGESADAGSGGGSAQLSISGNPPSSITQGTSFSFTPTVNNPSGGALTFTITNLPGWASFNPGNGRISGTPGPNDVGTYANIRITASNGADSVTSAAHTVEVVGTATGSVTLSWLPPTQNADGTPLVDLAGYRLYWGMSPAQLDNAVTLSNPSITTYVFDQLTPATWYFGATALNADGVESSMSNLASRAVF
jgi:hypothetical protein